MNNAIFIQEVTVTDPQSNAPVAVTIYKDMASGGMFGVDTSYILTLSEDDPVSSPFNGEDIQLIESVINTIFYKVDIRYIDDQTENSGLIFCSFNDLPDNSPYNDDDVFYYGMGFEEARLSIGKESVCNDFIITAVQSLNRDIHSGGIQND